MDKTNMPNLIGFLVETVQRFLGKSPQYFKYVQWIGIAAMVISGLPEVLEYLGVAVPVKLNDALSKAVFWAGLASAFVAKLPVPNAQAAASDPTTNQLPITAKEVAKEEGK